MILSNSSISLFNCLVSKGNVQRLSKFHNSGIKRTYDTNFTAKPFSMQNFIISANTRYSSDVRGPSDNSSFISIVKVAPLLIHFCQKCFWCTFFVWIIAECGLGPTGLLHFLHLHKSVHFLPECKHGHL